MFHYLLTYTILEDLDCPYFLCQVGRWVSPRFIINLMFSLFCCTFLGKYPQDTSGYFKGKVWTLYTNDQHWNEKALTAKQRESQWLEKSISWVRKLGGPWGVPSRTVSWRMQEGTQPRDTDSSRYAGLVGGSFKWFVLFWPPHISWANEFVLELYYQEIFRYWGFECFNSC